MELGSRLMRTRFGRDDSYIRGKKPKVLVTDIIDISDVPLKSQVEEKNY